MIEHLVAFDLIEGRQFLEFCRGVGRFLKDLIPFKCLFELFGIDEDEGVFAGCVCPVGAS